MEKEAVEKDSADLTTKYKQARLDNEDLREVVAPLFNSPKQ